METTADWDKAYGPTESSTSSKIKDKCYDCNHKMGNSCLCKPGCHLIYGFCHLFFAAILFIIGIQLVHGVVDYSSATMDYCEYNGYTTSISCKIESSTSCTGIKWQYYYDTINGTCDGNNTLYYQDIRCDCWYGDPSFVTINDTDTITKCWINECQGEEGKTWTLTPPEDINDGLIAWMIVSFAILFTVMGIVFCANSCRRECKKK